MLNAREQLLVDALKIVCTTLAKERDGQPLPHGWLEDLKYQVVDRAIEFAEPGFDGDTTSEAEARSSFTDYEKGIM